MIFERKEVEKKEQKNIYWTMLRWYWVLIPTFFFVFMVPNMLNDGRTGLENMNDFYTVVFHLTNFGWAGIMITTDPIEQSKSGVGNTILKVAMVHQVLTQNLFGIMLSFLAWYNLPYRVNPESKETDEKEKLYFKPKTLLILTGVIAFITLLSLLGQFTMGR